MDINVRNGRSSLHLLCLAVPVVPNRTDGMKHFLTVESEAVRDDNRPKRHRRHSGFGADGGLQFVTGCPQDGLGHGSLS